MILYFSWHVNFIFGLLVWNPICLFDIFSTGLCHAPGLYIPFGICFIFFFWSTNSNLRQLTCFFDFDFFFAKIVFCFFWHYTIGKPHPVTITTELSLNLKHLKFAFHLTISAMIISQVPIVCVQNKITPFAITMVPDSKSASSLHISVYFPCLLGILFHLGVANILLCWWCWRWCCTITGMHDTAMG